MLNNRKRKGGEMKNVNFIAPARSGHNFVREQFRSWDEDNQMRLYNMENLYPKDFNEKKTEYVYRGEIYDSRLPSINVLVTRDFLNWLASYVKWLAPKNMLNTIKITEAIEHWTAITLEAFGETEYLPEKLRVVYDEFKDNAGIRKWLSYHIGGTYSEKSLDLVVPAGGGSSFDGTDVKGSEMQTDERWMQINDTEYGGYYREVLKNSKIALMVYKRHFFVSENQRVFLKNI